MKIKNNDMISEVAKIKEHLAKSVKISIVISASYSKMLRQLLSHYIYVIGVRG